MKSKYHFLLAASIFVASTAVCADKLDSDGILRYRDGIIRLMNQYDAMSACPQGTHLPTIRELAVLSQASGAKGILEVSQVDPNEVPAGYYKVSAINPNGQKDEFYFSYEGYKRPSGDLGNNWFWSSSVSSFSSVYGYLFYSFRGAAYDIHRDYRSWVAVRCIAD